MPSAPRASLLLVDDRPENLLALRAILEPLDCDLVEAESGMEALKHLLGRDFALILMDVQMPGLDGFETAQLIKEREKTRHIPIIFVTALSKEQHYIFKGYGTGAVDYISKPFDPDILRSKVNVFADLWRKGEMLKLQAEVVLRNEQLEREREIAHLERLLSDKAREAAESARALAEEARAGAEAASKAKSEFIAGMSHELRTPLNAILGFSKLLLNPRVGPLNEDQSAYIGDVVRSAEHLLNLINDILDLSKIEAGKMTLDMGCLSPREEIEASLALVREAARESDLSISTEITPAVAALESVPGDARKVRQVLVNLLSNAVKFTLPGGSIAVRADIEEARAKSGNCLVVEVRDTGIGIAPENQERIFAAFEQVDSSYTRSQQGTGLGLAVSRRIIELHGGTLLLQSALGEGSTFSFRLPLRPAEVQNCANNRHEDAPEDLPEHSPKLTPQSDAHQAAPEALPNKASEAAESHGKESAPTKKSPKKAAAKAAAKAPAKPLAAKPPAKSTAKTPAKASAKR